MTPTITLFDLLTWLEPQTDDVVVGISCDGGNCVIARYVINRFSVRGIGVDSEIDATYIDGRPWYFTEKLCEHDESVQTLIEALDETPGAALTAGHVREVAARIIRNSQPLEADEHDPAQCLCKECNRERERITMVAQQRAESQEGWGDGNDIGRRDHCALRDRGVDLLHGLGHAARP